jgi:phage host-nuclease inhibitor protein Gam
MEKHHLHDLRRFRNEVDRHIHRLTDEQRSEKLGHSTKVNQEHYSADFDQTVVNMGNEIKSLQTKILLLQSELNAKESAV